MRRGPVGLLLLLLSASFPRPSSALNFSLRISGDPRIVGGGAASSAVPRLVSIHRFERHYCGGFLLSDTHVLTAAHCTLDIDVAHIAAHVFRLDISLNPAADTACAEALPVVGTLSHPDFVWSNDAPPLSDVAVLVLGRAPRCALPDASLHSLHDGSFSTDAATMIVLGWGALTYGGSSSSLLMQGEVERVSPSECQAAFRAASLEAYIDASVVCGTAVPADACQGDSGGPLFAIVSAPLPSLLPVTVLVGVVSWGIGCGGSFPGVYASVHHASAWLRQFLPTSLPLPPFPQPSPPPSLSAPLASPLPATPPPPPPALSPPPPRPGPCPPSPKKPPSPSPPLPPPPPPPPSPLPPLSSPIPAPSLPTLLFPSPPTPPRSIPPFLPPPPLLPAAAASESPTGLVVGLSTALLLVGVVLACAAASRGKLITAQSSQSSHLARPSVAQKSATLHRGTAGPTGMPMRWNVTQHARV